MWVRGGWKTHACFVREELWRSRCPRSKVCAERGRPGLRNRDWGAPTLAGGAMWGSFATSPQPWRGTEPVKLNLLKQLGCRFLGAAAGWVADPRVAELAWVGRNAAVCSAVQSVLPPVCVQGGGGCAGGCARTAPALFWWSSAPSLLCYPPSAPSAICAGSLSPIVRNFFSTVWAGDRF